VAEAEAHCKKLVERSKEIAATDFSTVSNEDLSRTTASFLDLFAGLFAYYNLSRPDYLTEIDTLVKKELVEKEPDEAKRQELFAVLTTSDLGTTYTEHEVAIFTAALEVLTKKDGLEAASERLATTYGWISTQEDNPALDANYYGERLTSLMQEGQNELESKLREHADKSKAVLKKKHDAVAQYGISKEAQELASSVAMLGRLRLQVRFWWTEASFYGKPLFAELNKRFGFADKSIGGFLYAEYLLRDEYLTVLSGAAKVSEQEVEERAERSALLMIDKKIELHIGDDATAVVDTYITKEDHSLVTEIRGSVANRGVVQGRAWVISPSVKSQSAKAAAMKKGDILVAAMTRPQFIDAISKASAIVTDEGGITCHAAIISRELNKPCVIGTKIATQAIKDGDLVEVDADKGIVRIIERL